MTKKRVLLVDYEPKLLERLESMLVDDRIELAMAKDGFAAIEEFDRFHPDMVFLRTMLPKKHGFQVCQEMVERSGSRRIPIIMHCSIYKSRKYRNDAIKVYGAAEYLEDPIQEGALKEILGKFLFGETPTVAPAPPAAAPGPAASTQAAPSSKPGTLPEVVLPPAAPSKPKSGGLSGVDKALEETLSGMNLGGTRKPKPAQTSSIEATVPLDDLLGGAKPSRLPEPSAAAPAPVPPPKGPAPVAPVPPTAVDQQELTSEELFGDVIQDVIKAEPAAPEAPQPVVPKAPEKPQTPPAATAAPVVLPPPPSPPKAPAPSRPSIDVDKALGSELISTGRPTEDSQVRRMKARSDSDLSRKLEETLGGVKLAPTAPKEAPKAAAPEPPAPVAAPSVAPPPEPPKAEPPKAEAVPEAPKAEPPKPEPVPEAPKAEAPQAPQVPESVSAGMEKAKAEKEGGVTYGNYLLVDKIATGGMAELFKARQKGLEGFSRIVAIKRILPHLAANQDFVTMFIDEAKLAAQLNHPNVCHIYDLGKMEDSYFIAMEYVEGKDLRAILKDLEPRKRLMPIRVVVYIAQKVADALQYAHTAKDVDGRPMVLVHRDISPQNILIATNGVVKLVDFGIAKAASKASHTQTGALKGKLLYMSPEQAWGKNIDHRTDIFSLGTVICEMLSGQKLFYGDSEMSILEKVREAKITPPQELRPDLPEELERILLKSLDRDPEKRYRDCRAMQADIERFAYEEWETAPSAYDTAAFLNEIFPDIYTREVLDTLKREPGTSDSSAERPAEPQRGGRPPKSQRGRPAPQKAPPPKREAPPPPEPKQEAKAEPKVEPKPAPKPEPPQPPKSQPAPRPEPPAKPEPKPEPKPLPPQPEPPKAAVQTGPGMFGDVIGEKPEGGNKKLILVAAGVAALLVIVAILYFAFGGKKAPATEPAKPAPATGASTQPAPAPVPPPVIETPKPAEPAPNAPPATEAELAAAKKAAGDALTAFGKSVSDVEQAGAGQYASESLASLKKSHQNIAALYRKAKTKEEYQAVTQALGQGATLVTQVRTQVDQAKSAEQASNQKKAADDAAAKKAADDAAKKAEAASGKAKAGDLVELWSVDVKPKEISKPKLEYPPMARANKVQGQVYIEAQIDETGRVTSAKIVRGINPDYGLNDAALKAALQAKYSPAIKDGVPVKTVYTYPMSFKIQ